MLRLWIDDRRIASATPTHNIQAAVRLIMLIGEFDSPHNWRAGSETTWRRGHMHLREAITYGEVIPATDAFDAALGS